MVMIRYDDNNSFKKMREEPKRSRGRNKRKKERHDIDRKKSNR